MEKLEILKQNVTAAYESGDESQQHLLKKLWPDVFADEPYLKACKILGLLPRPELADRSNSDLVSEDGFHRLTICIRVKNMINGEIWKAIYNGTENHYFPRWKPNPAGFGLAGTHYVRWDTDTLTVVGERLEYRTYGLMMEGVKEFDKYYQDYYLL